LSNVKVSIMSAQSLKLVRLELARSKQFPQGSARHGYELVAPLDADGHIDATMWKANRAACWVKRFWAGEDDHMGKLVQKPGGPEHERWIFDYDQTGDDDEAGYRLASHAFSPGEYVSIRDAENELHTFSVASVEPLR
jgi:hypothetical protein